MDTCRSTYHRTLASIRHLIHPTKLESMRDEEEAFVNQRASLTALEVGLLTGGSDKPYALGLANALLSREVHLDFIGSDELDSAELHRSPKLRYLNLRGSQREDAGLFAKIGRISFYYARLIWYATTAKPRLFHILWNNRFLVFDRTVLTCYYKLMGKKIVLTAHNVNQAGRDLNDSLLNRLTLRIQYRLAHHIFVHTEKMKKELEMEFGVREQFITVIPFGINNTVHNTHLSPQEAKKILGINNRDKAILFFGRIGPYKGLEFLASAFQLLAKRRSDYRLIIVGKPKKGAETYLDTILQTLSSEIACRKLIQRIEFTPDEDTELYFKAADVAVLPYTRVCQSGVLFLAYSFGLPVIASRVGSFEEDIEPGRTGFVCDPCDPVGLASAIETYFESDLFKELDNRRLDIRQYVNLRNSWDVVSMMTINVYNKLLPFREYTGVPEATQ
jgi:glycosyltransferase involved in cell wall biosynthesis